MGKSQGPLVSVIINCFNGEKYLLDSIVSLVSQTYSNWELIFWDNQSTDNSAEIIKSFKDERIRYYYAKSHTVLYEARNAALKKTKGDYIAFLDSDDTWETNKLELQIPLFLDSEVIFTFSNYFIENIIKKKKWLGLINPKIDGPPENVMLKNYMVAMSTLVIRRSAISKYRLEFNSNYSIIGDFDMVLRLASIGKFAYINSALAIYRIHGNNESTKKRDLEIGELKQFYTEHLTKKSPLSLNPYFWKIKALIDYASCINFLLNGKKYKALQCFFRMKICKLKFRLFFILLLPKDVLKKIKN